jgi:hypothetical protein
MFDFDVVRSISRKITIEEDPKKIDQFLSNLHDIVSQELGTSRTEQGSARQIGAESTRAASRGKSCSR